MIFVVENGYYVLKKQLFDILHLKVKSYLHKMLVQLKKKNKINFISSGTQYKKNIYATNQPIYYIMTTMNIVIFAIYV